MQITSYQDHHFNGVEALWRDVFPDDPPHNAAAVAVPQKMKHQPDLFVVALDADQVVGTIMAGYDGHRGWLYAVAVRRSHRNSGLGTALVREAERRLIGLGCTKINLQVRVGNERVIGFYRAVGYGVEERVSMGKRV